VDLSNTLAVRRAGLPGLRRAAVLAHRFGAVTLGVTSGADHHVAVRRHPSRWDFPDSRVVDALRFRLAVARACATPPTGAAVRLMGLDFTASLDVSLSVSAPGQHLGLGAVRVPGPERAVWAFASLLGVAELAAVLALADDGEFSDVSTDRVEVRVVADDLLQAAIVEVRAHPGAPTARMDGLLHAMVAAVGAAEIVGELA
jgi:hypothetical protein